VATRIHGAAQTREAVVVTEDRILEGVVMVAKILGEEVDTVARTPGVVVAGDTEETTLEAAAEEVTDLVVVTEEAMGVCTIYNIYDVNTLSYYPLLYGCPYPTHCLRSTDPRLM